MAVTVIRESTTAHGASAVKVLYLQRLVTDEGEEKSDADCLYYHIENRGFAYKCHMGGRVCEKCKFSVSFSQASYVLTFGLVCNFDRKWYNSVIHQDT